MIIWSSSSFTPCLADPEAQASRLLRDQLKDSGKHHTLPAPQRPQTEAPPKFQMEEPVRATEPNFFQLKADWKLDKNAFSLPEEIFQAINSNQAGALANKYFEEGVSKYEGGEYAKAADRLKKATLLNPQIADAHYYLANSYVHEHNDEGAVQQYLAVLRLNRDGRAGLYAQNALADYQRLAVRNQQSTVSYCWSGIYPSISWHCGSPPIGEASWLNWDMRLVDALAPYIQTQAALLDRSSLNAHSRATVMCAVVYFEVTPDRKIEAVRLTQKTNTAYDLLVLDAVRDLEGSNLLQFPAEMDHNVGVAFCTDLHRLWGGMQGCQCEHRWDQVLAPH